MKSKGPRYCPSIEDKVKRFSEKDSHQIFLEPETQDGEIVYPNGISNSLPEEIQEKFIRTIKGLEKCKISAYGYAIEYDCIDSAELNQTYETKKIKGLYLAGQINGTTGYEEAAAQGLMAGINAARNITGKSEIIIGRETAYIGVLTSDICRGGLVEPYRMFTSRAEYRLMLRADNADERLTDLGIRIGTVCSKRKTAWLNKKSEINQVIELFKSLSGSPQLFQKYGVKINHDGKKEMLLSCLVTKALDGMIFKIYGQKLKILKFLMKLRIKFLIQLFTAGILVG